MDEQIQAENLRHHSELDEIDKQERRNFIFNPGHLRLTKERRVAENQRHFEELQKIEEKRRSEAEEKEREERRIEKLNYAIHDIISNHTLEILKSPKTFCNYLKDYTKNESLSEINAIYGVLEIPIQWQNAIGRVFKNRDFLIGKIIEDYYSSNAEDAKFALEKIIDALFDLDIIYFEDVKKVYKIIPSQIISHKEKPAFLEFDNALKKIITDNGTGILDNIDRCRGLLKDYSGDAYLDEINRLVQILKESTEIDSRMLVTADKMTKAVITLLFSVLNEMGLEHPIVRKLQEQQRIEKQRRLKQEAAELRRQNKEARQKLAKQQEDERLRIRRILAGGLRGVDYSGRSVSWKPDGKKDERMRQENSALLNPVLKIAASVLLLIILISIGFNSRNANAKSNSVQKIPASHYETAPQKNQSKTASSQPVTYGFVSAAALNMRSAASATGSIITQLHQNDSVQVLSSSGAWSKIQFNNSVGFVNNSYLSAKPIPVNNSRAQERSAAVQAPKLNLAEKEGIEKN